MTLNLTFSSGGTYASRTSVSRCVCFCIAVAHTFRCGALVTALANFATTFSCLVTTAKPWTYRRRTRRCSGFGCCCHLCCGCRLRGCRCNLFFVYVFFCWFCFVFGFIFICIICWKCYWMLLFLLWTFNAIQRIWGVINWWKKCNIFITQLCKILFNNIK